jgi:hypothetical protein
MVSVILVDDNRQGKRDMPGVHRCSRRCHVRRGYACVTDDSVHFWWLMKLSIKWERWNMATCSLEGWCQSSGVHHRIFDMPCMAMINSFDAPSDLSYLYETISKMTGVITVQDAVRREWIYKRGRWIAGTSSLASLPNPRVNVIEELQM